QRVAQGFADGCQVFGIVSPQSDGMIVLAQQISQRGPPCSGADHGHIHVFFFPMRLSAPVSRRWMLALCLYIASKLSPVIAPVMVGLPFQNQTANGRIIAAAMEASETYLLVASTDPHSASAVKQASGAQASTT